MTDVPAIPASNALTTYNADDDFQLMRKSDIIAPRLALQQFLSPGVTSQLYKPGDYVVESEKRVVVPFGKIGVVTPLMFWMNWIEWNPDRDNADKDKKIIDSSFDPQSALCKRAERFEEVQTPKGPKLAVTEYYNWIVALNGTPDKLVYNWDDLAVLNFSKSSHRRGKEFLNRLYKIKQPDGSRAPMCSHNFDLKVEFVDGGPNKKYMVPEFGVSVRETPAEQLPMLLEMVQALRNSRMELMQRDMEREKETGAASEASAPLENPDKI